MTIHFSPLSLSDIYSDFQKLTTLSDQLSYLRSLSLLDLPYDINYDNLITAWTRGE